MSAATQNIHSVGMICQLIQQMPSKIRSAASDLGIAPVLTINGVAHFSEKDVRRIGVFLRSQPTSKE